uniref:Integrase catalytic domain-containing protein n=1 Tax=Clytia hemisphaerica TaxID=252671 RepID=A0A7M5XNW1_9CNID
MLKNLKPSIIVQRDRVAKLLAHIDPHGVSRRWAQVIPRRVYSVATPNSLWHIDTNHKLIRWNFVLDGCIDGYSRLVVLLQLHTNNLASSMLSDFLTATNCYGIPSRVRADKGGEFTHIRKLMDEVNGQGRGSFIAGKSVHNVRIERLWRDVYTKVLEKFHDLFCAMEERRVLDINNHVHLACLHYVFGKRIQQCLNFWKLAHNDHPVRLEKNKSPKQLWHNASMLYSNKENTAMTSLFRRDPSEYEPIFERFRNIYTLPEPDSIKIVLPRFSLPLSDEQLGRLSASINVLRESNYDGIDIYVEVMKFVHENVTM